MVPLKPALWALLLALLGLAPVQAGLRTCSVPDMLRHYRVVIFEDLQAAVRQEHDILLSIASLGRTLRRVVARGRRRGALEKASWAVALRTEALMRRHCWTLRQRRRRPKRHPPRRRRSRSRRQLLLRVLDTIATCWEKLFALRAAATEGS